VRTTNGPFSIERRAASKVIFFHGIASFAWGTVYPYTAIYLAGLPKVGIGGVALYYGVAGTTNLIVALTLATGAIRPAPIPLGVCGTTLSVIGYAIMPFVSSNPMVMLAALAIGSGQACFLAAVIPTLNLLIDESERRQVFARRYQVLNGTLALGGLTAGGLTAALSHNILPYLFGITALGYVPITTVQLKIRRLVNDRQNDTSAPTRPQGTGILSSMAALLKSCRFVALFQLGVFFIGFSQFESTAPLAANKLLNIDLVWFAVMLGANTIVIVFAQDYMTKRLEPYDAIFGLRTALGFWVAGYLVIALLALGPPELTIVGLLLYAVLFGLGECAYSCTYHPWLISSVPERDLTRANALANSLMGIGMLAGPTLGVALVTTGNATVVWLALASATLLVGFTTVRTTANQLISSERDALPATRPAHQPSTPPA